MARGSTVDKSIQPYLRDISKYSPLSRTQERELIARYQKNGDRDAFNKIICCNLRFVVSVALNYKNQGMVLGDLIYHGNQGLTTAVDHFKLKFNVKFISYAVWWIRQTILFGLGEDSRFTRIPASWNTHLSKAFKIKEKHEKKDGEEYPIESVLEDMFRKKNGKIFDEGLDDVVDKGKNYKTKEKGIYLKEMAAMSKPLLRLDHPLRESPGGRDDDNKNSLYSLIPDLNHNYLDGKADMNDLRGVIEATLSKLRGNEEIIMREYFGLVDGEVDHEGKTLEDIGNLLSISKERVRQVKKKVLEELALPSGRGKVLRKYYKGELV